MQILAGPSHSLVLPAIAMLVMGIPAMSLHAQTAAVTSPVIPQMMKYSGVAVDSARDTVEVVFRIYSGAESGEALWSEAQRVVVGQDGTYSVLLGAATEGGLPQTVFASGQALWLGVSIERAPELARIPLVSVPYAMKAADAETLGGVPASEFVTQGQIRTANPPAPEAHDSAATRGAVHANGSPTGTPNGSGTGGVIPLWYNSDTLTNSALTEQASSITTTSSFEATGGIVGQFTGDTHNAAGVLGTNTAATGIVSGVIGRASSSTSDSSGVKGFESALKGQVFGVNGGTDSITANSAGVVGYEGASSGEVYGVIGNAVSKTTNAAGVVGSESATTGQVYGVIGQSDSIGPSAAGVVGTETAATGSNAGVIGQTASTSGSGVFGIATATTGGTSGVTGVTSSSNSTAAGVVGQARAAGGTAGRFVNKAGSGLILQGISKSTQVFSVDASGNGTFDGNLDVTGKLTKGSGSFKIDDPLDPANKYLSHSFVESPDMMNVYNGNIVTDRRGMATVILPDYFEALNRDFRYQLTVIGQFAQAIVASKVAKNRFVIRTSRPGVEVSWQVTGIRQDAFANADRIPVEEDKPASERGYYLHPEAFGQPASKGVSAANNPAPPAIGIQANSR
jgi:trimeric autotransporter adhesin